MFSCLLIRDGNEAESARASLGLKLGQITRLAVALEVFGSAIDPCLTFGEQAVDDTGQVAGHGLNGFGAAKPGTKIPVAGAEITVAAQQCIGSHAQDARNTVPAFLTRVPDHFSAADIASGG